MRLGLYPARLLRGSIAEDAYSYFAGKRLPKATTSIRERHRHRYEVNPKYVERLEKGGLVFSGKSPDGVLMELCPQEEGEGHSILRIGVFCAILYGP